MYPTHAIRGGVRDRRAPYGSGGRVDGAGSDPAYACLLDLATAGPTDALRIVARFCVLRWLALRHVGGEADLLRHARDAARWNLASVEAEWAEAEELVGLVERTEPLAGTLARLRAVARTAEAAGHVHGARAARRTACLLILGWDPEPGSN